MPSLLEIGPLVLEKKFIAISLLSSLENRVALHFNKLESPLPKDAKCAKFGGNWPSGSGEDENVKSIRQRKQRRLN